MEEVRTRLEALVAIRSTRILTADERDLWDRLTFREEELLGLRAESGEWLGSSQIGAYRRPPESGADFNA